jgi:nucleotide-binding universal stress UspA family protein
MIRVGHVVVATDFSEASAAALNYGRELARISGGTLHLLHVVDDVVARYTLEAVVLVPVNLQTEVENVARRRLEGLLGDDDRRELGAKAVLRTSSATAEEIVEYAREVNADVIVIGTHGRGTLSRLLLGSVAERVVRLAPCPVLTVRHPQHEFVAPDALVTVGKA